MRDSADPRLEPTIRQSYDRRAFLRLAGATGLSGLGLLALAGCGGVPGLGAGTIKTTMFVWVGSNQGVVPREVREEYLKEHKNVEIELLEGTNAETYPKIKASLQTTPNNPLANFGFFNVDATTKGTVDNVWLPLDVKQVPNLNGIFDAFRRPNDVGVFWGMSAIGLVYHKEKVNPPPTSWADLWDPKFKGKVAFWDAPAWSFNGLVQTARMNGGGEENIEPGMRVYADAAKRGHIHSLYSTNDGLKTLIVNGDVWISPFFKGIMAPWEEEGAPIGYVVPKEGQIAFPLGFQMIRGSNEGQQRVAQEMINRMLDPRVLGRYCSLTASIPAGKDVPLDPKYANDPAFKQENVERAIQLDWLAIAKNNDQWVEMWNKEVKANLS